MGSPYLSRERESDPQGKLREVWVQERGKSEGSSAMGEIGVEQTCKITPRESEQVRHEVADVIVVAQNRGNNLLFCQ
jgi:hypothetical protein